MPGRAAASRMVEAGGLTFDVLEAGAGGRPLFLEHGFCGAKEDFADVLVPLAERGWHVVAPDLRGHGSSEHPRGESAYTLATFTDDVLALADVLGWETMTLVGHSMGGMIAQVIAIDHGERLDGLVLMDTGHGPVRGIDPDMLELGKQVVRSEGLGTLVELMKSVDPLSTPAHERLLRERPGFREFTDNKTLVCSPEMWLSVAGAMVSQEDRLADLSRISVPTLVIVGEQDEVFLGDSQRMADRIPGAALAVIPDAGHSPHVENPDAWWAVLLTFLEGIPGRGAREIVQGER